MAMNWEAQVALNAIYGRNVRKYDADAIWALGRGVAGGLVTEAISGGSVLSEIIEQRHKVLMKNIDQYISAL